MSDAPNVVSPRDAYWSAMAGFVPLVGAFLMGAASSREARRQAWWASLHPFERGFRWALGYACLWASRRLERLYGWCADGPEVGRG